MLGNVFVSFHRVKCSGWNSCAGARGIAPSFTVFSLSSYFVVLESKGPSNFNSHFFFFFFPYNHISMTKFVVTGDQCFIFPLIM